LHIFFLLAFIACFISWTLGGTGLIVNRLFDEACGMMQEYVDGSGNAWLQDALPCNELREAEKGVFTAMEAANLAIEEANEQVEGVRQQQK
jgi:hypothetical protein